MLHFIKSIIANLFFAEEFEYLEYLESGRKRQRHYLDETNKELVCLKETLKQNDDAYENLIKEYKLSLEKNESLESELNEVFQIYFDTVDQIEKLEHEKSSLSKQVSTLDKKLNKKNIELESRMGKRCCSGDFCECVYTEPSLGVYNIHASSGCSTTIKQELSDNVAVYVDDLAGGKVIKQEANKCVKINKEGEIEEGYTKKKCDKGYSYKLIRE